MNADAIRWAIKRALAANRAEMTSDLLDAIVQEIERELPKPEAAASSAQHPYEGTGRVGRSQASDYPPDLSRRTGEPTY